MGFFQKIKAWALDDWCTGCTEQMKLVKKQLFVLPMTVGHYVDHDDPNYYETNLQKVAKKADIPAGFYACGMYLYQCPKCQKKVVKIINFLPVRGEEQVDGAHLFESGELVDFIEKC